MSYTIFKMAQLRREEESRKEIDMCCKEALVELAEAARSVLFKQSLIPCKCYTCFLNLEGKYCTSDFHTVIPNDMNACPKECGIESFRYEILRQTLKEYLEYDSADGKKERMPLRKKLKALLDMR